MYENFYLNYFAKGLKIIDIVLLFFFYFIFIQLFYFQNKVSYYKVLFKSILLFIVINIIFILFIVFDNSILIILNLFVVVFLFLHMIRYFPDNRKNNFYDYYTKKYERDTMFARNALQFDDEHYKLYYSMHPDKEKIDKRIHKMKELGEPGSKYYDYLLTNISSATFIVNGKIAPIFRNNEVINNKTNNEENKKVVDEEIKNIEKYSYELNNEINNNKIINSETNKNETNRNETNKNGENDNTENSNVFDKKKITEVIKFIGKYYGAVDIGITRLQDHHAYSYHGRRKENWGEEINLRHKYAIVIFVKMDYFRIKNSPKVDIILESAKHYLESAKIAFVISEYIKLLGFDAKPHIDGNYDVLCVSTADSTGLGTIGKNNLFIHHKYGPLIRTSVVTTDLEFIEEKPVKHYIDNLCRICNNCINSCPVKAFKKIDSNKFVHRQEVCFSYWKVIGTDCAKCIRTCPLSKPDILLFRIFKYYLFRNLLTLKIGLNSTKFVFIFAKFLTL